MNVALFGHGYVGQAIAYELRAQKVPFFWHSHGARPLGFDLVINAAGFVGRPNADACEVQRAACIEGNILWPLQLEEWMDGKPVIHIGSGCLYQGGPRKETDPPGTPLPFYSECRVMLEKALAPHLSKSYLLRIRQPFSAMEHPHNLLTKLTRYPRLIDHRNSISCLEDVAKIVAHFVKARPEPGIYNCTSPGSISNREIADMLGLTKDWMTEDEFRQAVKAPRTVCTLDTSKLQSVYPMRPVEHALMDCIQLRRQAA